MNKYTPIIIQYLKIKKKYKDGLLFYQIGDFYELFYNDAIKISSLLGIFLTKKKFVNQKSIPMAGVPIHSSDYHISKLIKLGQTIVLCNQVLNDLKYNCLVKNKNKLINRVVTKIITPGTVTNNDFICNKLDNYIGCIYYCDKKRKFGFSYLDIFTGIFYLWETSSLEKIKCELYRTNIKELLYPENFKFMELINFIKCLNILDISNYNYYNNYNILLSHFNVLSLDCFGVEKYIVGINVAGCLLKYVKSTQINELKYINKIKLKNNSKYIFMNFSTIKNLELFDSLSGNKTKTLFYILNNTSTPMGCRMLRRWIMYPITDIKKIKYRHYIMDNILKKNNILIFFLKKIGDLERIIGKIFLYNINQKDLINFKYYLFIIFKIIFLFYKNNINIINFLYKYKKKIKKIFKLVNISIVDPSIDNKNIILSGYNKKLDVFKKKKKKYKKKILKFEILEKKKLKIKSLVINYSKLHGFYIQIKKNDLKLVPNNYIKYQIFKKYSRYFTINLKKIEWKFLNYKKKIKILEKKIFNKILCNINRNINFLKKVSFYISKLDVLSNLLNVSINLNYVKPNFSLSSEIKIIKGRHAILEQNIDFDFIPNNLYFDKKDNRSLLITGPNMGGKSTYMRQIALIVILSYIGCFVPAEYLSIGPIDKILTRIGFCDDILSNKSTFMVEMNDISNIINFSTYNSLVLIDEMGRGTSFYEGISIAWACLYYILKFINCMMLFSTHYVELTEISKRFNNIKNVYFTFIKDNLNIIPLYKIKKGICYQSFGIYLSMKVGIPDLILKLSKYKFNKMLINNINKNILYENNLCFNKKHKIILNLISNINIDKISIVKLYKKIKYIKSIL